MLKTNEKVEKKCMFVVSYMVMLAVENFWGLPKEVNVILEGSLLEMYLCCKSC